MDSAAGFSEYATPSRRQRRRVPREKAVAVMQQITGVGVKSEGLVQLLAGQAAVGCAVTLQ